MQMEHRGQGRTGWKVMNSTMAQIRAIYDRHVRAQGHRQWQLAAQ
jgi:hypothetical protein